MKNLITAFLFICLIISCQQPASTEVTEVDDTPTPKMLIDSLYNNFAQGNIEAVLAGFAPDIVWNEAENFIYADGNPYVGPQAVLEGVFGRIGADFDNFRLENITTSSLDDDGVLGTGRYRGTRKTNGMELDAQFAHVFRLKDQKVVSFQQYTDTKHSHDVYFAEAK